MEDLLRAYGIKELARTGKIALARGSKEKLGGARQMATIYYEKDCDLSLIKDRKIAVIGYGSQGHAHALNLHDSGCDVRVGLRTGSKSWDKVKEDGLKVMTPREAAAEADIVMMLTPDETQAHIYYSEIHESMTAGKVLAFAHGFNIHFNQIEPPEDVDVIMIAPKGPGHMVRRVFTEGSGVPCLIAIHQDATGKAREIALAWAAGIGGARCRRHRDHLCRGDRDRPLRRAGRAVRRRDRARQGGLRDARRGRLPARDRVLRVPARAQAHRRPHVRGRHGQDVRLDLATPPSTARTSPARASSPTRRARRWRKILWEIQNGTFARNWILENKAGQAHFKATRRINAEHLIEDVGGELREMFAWIDEE